jgi:hypothetical protein
MSTALNSVDEAFKGGLSAADNLRAINGKSPLQVYKETFGNYSKFKSGYDEFANKINNVNNPAELAKLAKDMTAEKGNVFLQAFKDMAEATGNSSKSFQQLDELNKLSAAHNLASRKRGLVSALAGSSIGGMVAGPVGGMAGLVAGSTVNANTVSALAAKGAGAKLAADAVAKRLQPLTSIARGSDFLRALPAQDRIKLFTSEQMMQDFLGGILSAPSLQQQTEQQLLQQVP